MAVQQPGEDVSPEYPKMGDIGSGTKPAFKGRDGRRVGKSAVQHIDRVVDGFGPHLQWTPLAWSRLRAASTLERWSRSAIPFRSVGGTSLELNPKSEQRRLECVVDKIGPTIATEHRHLLTGVGENLLGKLKETIGGL